MTNPKDSAAPATVKSSAVQITLDHPRLLRTDPESIHAFLRKYDSYSTTVLARAKQLAPGSLSTESIQPVDIKFCVDAEFLESRIAMGLIEVATDFASITNAQVREFLDNRCKASRTAVTLEDLDRIVKQKLRTDMRNRDAVSRIEDLFTNYHTLLRRNGVEWLITENQKIAVNHVLSAIRPQSLLDRLTADLSFHKHPLRKDFKGFFAHSLDLAAAVQKLDSNKQGTTGGGGRSGGGGSGGGGSGGGGGGGGTNMGNNNNNGQGTGNAAGNKYTGGGNQNSGGELPLCLWEPHAKKGFRHLLKDCRECPPAEKRKLYKKRAEDFARDGPASGTRSQTTPAPAQNDKTPAKEEPRTTGRLQNPVDLTNSPSCYAEIFDGASSHSCTARCDDGSDESVASPTIPQAAVVQGVGKMTEIQPIRLRVALRDPTTGDEPRTFTFSRLWVVPRLVLHLSVGKLALLNITFLVSDDEMECEDILVGYPVLHHLGIDSRTMLEKQFEHIDGTDCTGVDPQRHPTGNLGRLMIARLQREPSPTFDPQRPRSNYFDNQNNDDPFPDPSLIQINNHTADTSEKNAAIDAMLEKAKSNGFPMEHWDEFEKLIRKHTTQCLAQAFQNHQPKSHPCG